LDQAHAVKFMVVRYRKVSDDLHDLGERCGIIRVHRIMRSVGLRSQTGYGKREWKGGVPSVVAANHLQRQFDVLEQNRVWVTDITYIRTHEGWLYLAVVLNLFSRQVIGRSMSSRIDTELARFPERASERQAWADVETARTIPSTEHPQGRLRVDIPGGLTRALILSQLAQFQARYPDIINDRQVDLIAGTVAVNKTGLYIKLGLAGGGLMQLAEILVADHLRSGDLVEVTGDM
jgi:transposase InsO family protein